MIGAGIIAIVDRVRVPTHSEASIFGITIRTEIVVLSNLETPLALIIQIG
jgi:hypothetical protein